MLTATGKPLSLVDIPYRSAGATLTSSAAPAPVMAGFEMLRRGLDGAVDGTGRADPRYWTPYDYFMIEREARAARSAKIGELVVRGATALRDWWRQR